jgi:hypothetical protein
MNTKAHVDQKSIWLYCPKCKRRQKARRDESDPTGTVVVRAQCPKCCGGDFDAPAYFDKDGNELRFEQATD